MRPLAIQLSLILIALYSALLSWKLFQTDAQYGEIVVQGSGSSAKLISDNKTYPVGDVRFEILEQKQLNVPDANEDSNLRVVRNLRLAEFKEPISYEQINNLVRHELRGYGTGYDIHVLINYALTISQGRFISFGDVFELAMVRFDQLSFPLRNRTINLCNLRYSSLPKSYQQRIIYNVVVNNRAKEVYNRSFNKDLMSDLYPYL